MKANKYLIPILILMSINATSQVAINTNGSLPDSSAMLDIQSTSKGVLLPRMNISERSAIPNPAEGLSVFCTNCGEYGSPTISIYTLGVWRNIRLCSTPISPDSATSISSLTEITWKWASDPTSYYLKPVYYRWNSDNDFDNGIDLGEDTSYVETGLTCGTAYTRYVWAYDLCGVSPATQLNLSTDDCTPNCNIVDNYGNTYCEITNPVTGKMWLDRNLGASQAATSVDDYLAYGSLFQWGRLADGHELISWSSQTNGTPVNGTTDVTSPTDDPNHSLFITTVTDPLDWRVPQNDLLWQGLTGINNPCPTGFRLPTKTEMDEEIATWGSINANGAFGSVLKLVLAGNRHPYLGGAPIGSVTGTYWTSSINPVGVYNPFNLTFDSDTAYTQDYSARAHGLSVRCIKDMALSSPTSGTHIPSSNQIIWNWLPVSEATGYKFNTTSDYSTAIDLGTDTSYTETGLVCDSLYTRYVWAYNGGANSYPTLLSTSTTDCGTWTCGDSITDTRDGQKYATILIGTQCWMGENLNIGTQLSGATEQSNNSIIEKYCYNNSQSNCDVYGGLYQWDEMMQYSTEEGIQGICQQGWHLPASEEWSILITYLGGENVAGGKMKEFGLDHWNPPNTGATNESGFTAIAGGVRSQNTNFYGVGDYVYFWESLEDDPTSTWVRRLYHDSVGVNRYEIAKYHGFSVRCIKDNTLQSPIEGTHTSSTNQIIWNWHPVSGATGYKWNTENNYSTATDVGTDTSMLETGLTCGTIYSRYVWAFNASANSTATALNQSTTVCNTWACGDSLTDDRDGRKYATVLIGTQCWMGENLNIGTQLSGATEQSNNSIIEKYCYNNSQSNCDVYGGLYQWDEMMQYSTEEGIQGICQQGWHLPASEEWSILITYLGGENVAGGKMKEFGLDHWNPPNTGATNESGFTAFGGGGRGTGGTFNLIGSCGDYWTSTNSSQLSFMNRMITDVASISTLVFWNYIGLSVRCVKD